MSLVRQGDLTRYGTIVADPPWELDTKEIGVGGRRANPTAVPYEFQTLEWIKALPVADWAADKAHLYMWTTRELFREGTAAEVVRAWGFEPCGEIIWGLRNAGMGGFLGNGHEPIILGRRGGLAWPENALPHGVEFWRQLYLKGKVHSAKPEAFLDHVEQWSPGPRLEMFARRARFGWDYWGDQSLGTAEVAA